jgi:hypothetical protein
MNQKDDYISGPHSFWAHFVLGFIFGGIVAGWFTRWLFGNFLVVVGGAVLSALCFAFFCGKWGDRGWKAIFGSQWWRSGW